MTRLEKGGVYILYSETKRHWYMVKQVGMKSWIATNFTNVDVTKDNYQFRSNAVDLWKLLQPRKDFRVAYNNASFRAFMFNVLKYGRLAKD